VLAAALRQVIGLITGLLMCFVGPVSSGGPVFCLPQALLFMLRQRKGEQKKGKVSRTGFRPVGQCFACRRPYFFASPKKR